VFTCRSTIALLLLASLPLAAGAATLTVGSKRFTESYILGEIVAQAAAGAGEAKVENTPGLGNTGIVFQALQTGAIDVYPEYTGTIAREILQRNEELDLAALNRALAPMSLAAGVPLGFNNSYALAMRSKQAAELGIRNISDLARHPQLKFGLSQEFILRTDGWPGLKQRYGLAAEPRGLDHGLAFDAIAAGQIDVIDIYTTDAKIRSYDLVVLDDDQAYFPKYDAVLFYRADLPQRFPRTWERLQKLTGTLPAERMIALNAEAEIGHRDFASIAGDFVAGREGGKMHASFMQRLFAPDTTRLLLQHLGLVFGSLLAAIVVAIPLGILAARVPALAQPVLGVAGVLQTIPSLALLAFLIPVMGEIGAAPALVALFLYALLPIVRNTYAGLTEVAPNMHQAGLALGLSSFDCLIHIELPLASGMILAGIKTSAVINVGTATIAAFIGAGGFGERIAAGLALNDTNMLLAGAVPSAVLALLVQWGFEFVEKKFAPSVPRR
jgi:osmoprotectant transport system permease protein